MSFIERFKIKRRIKHLNKIRKKTVRRMATCYEMMLYTPKSQHAMIQEIIDDYERKDFPVWKEIHHLTEQLH